MKVTKSQELLKKRLIEYLKDREVTFAQMSKEIEGFDGHVDIQLENYNILLWLDVSEDLSKALFELIHEGKVSMEVSSVHLYQEDGMVLDLPIAKVDRIYSSLRWLPVVFSS